MTEETRSSTTPRQLKSLAIENIPYPIVLRGFISKWSPMVWSLGDWTEKFGDKKLPFRVGKIEAKRHGEPTWERNCSIELMTMKEFLSWESGLEGQPKNKWMYFDYKYMQEWFGNDPTFLKEFDWGCLGFDGRHGRESTLWIGSHGAHTPCHADSYGFNLVAQLIGRKRWLLFPPDSKPLLQRASRIPYEESSVYVKGSVGGGYGGARGILLSPGEVLLVPRHWWHRVDVEGGIAISVNSWIPSEHDKESRLEESLVRFLFASSVQNLPPEWQKTLLNPNEDDLTSTPLSECLQLVKQSLEAFTSPLQQMNSMEFSQEANESETNHSPPKKRMKISVEGTSQKVETNEKPSVHVLPLVGREGWSSWHSPPSHSCIESDSLGDDVDVLQRMLNAFCHPEVISLVRQKMLQTIVDVDCPTYTSS